MLSIRTAEPAGRGLGLGAFVLGLALLAGCDGKSPSAPATNTPAPAAVSATGAPDTPVPAYTYEVVNSWPHDRAAFTEGLVYLKGILIESTGLNGQSTVRKVELQSGRVLQQIKMSPEYFGEGMTVLGGKIYQLTYQTQKGFVYNLDTLEVGKTFTYTGEGWGLTTDGTSLIMTDGTNQIRFIDPATFKVKRTISVFDHGLAVANLNELEWVKGELYANIWKTDSVVRIDPATGKLLGLVDFSGLLTFRDYDRNTDVMNGIAYDAATDRLFVTGKDWPKVFEVRLKPR